jgi:RNA-directed DNA polymerase
MEVLSNVRERLRQCDLSLNEKKTKIVYCQNHRREKKDYQVKFDFLGFSFQPRPARSQQGGMFLVYDCAISLDSEKRIVKAIKASNFQRWTNIPIERIAELFNPRIRGWINYYGKFRRSKLGRIVKRFHFHLMKWVLNRYKRFKTSTKRAYKWLRELRTQNPKLFYHWQVGFKEM